MGFILKNLHNDKEVYITQELLKEFIDESFWELLMDEIG